MLLLNFTDLDIKVMARQSMLGQLNIRCNLTPANCYRGHGPQALIPWLLLFLIQGMLTVVIIHALFVGRKALGGITFRTRVFWEEIVSCGDARMPTFFSTSGKTRLLGP
jgi:hypothetical protein